MRIFRVLRWVGAGLLIYLVALVCLAPAKMLYAYTAEQMQPLELYEVEGTALSGAARSGSYEAIPLEKLEWSFAPASLLGFKPGYDVSGVVGGNKLQGRVASRGGESATITNARLLGTLEDILKLTGAPAQIGTLAGNVTLLLDEAEIVDGKLAGLKAKGSIGSLQHGGLKDLIIGDFDLTADTKDDVTTITAKDSDGVLAMDLTFTLDAEQNFVLAGTLKPREKAPNSLRSLMLLFGKRQPDGSFLVDRKGALTPAAAGTATASVGGVSKRLVAAR